MRAAVYISADQPANDASPYDPTVRQGEHQGRISHDILDPGQGIQELRSDKPGDHERDSQRIEPGHIDPHLFSSPFRDQKSSYDPDCYKQSVSMDRERSDRK